MKLNVVELGRMKYSEALDIQLSLLEKRQRDEIEDTLLLVEHEPVITLGKNARDENVLFSREYLEKKGIDLVEINRGGDVTYHGPGQIVGYPIVNIKKKKLGIRVFVEKLEQVFIDLLQDKYNIKATRDDINNGVWVDGEKITAVGLAVKKWVTMHGFAFNVATDLDFFKLIVPCGIASRGVTNLEKLTGKKIDLCEMNKVVIKYFIEEFDYSEVNKLNLRDIL